MYTNINIFFNPEAVKYVLLHYFQWCSGRQRHDNLTYKFQCERCSHKKFFDEYLFSNFILRFLHVVHVQCYSISCTTRLKNGGWTMTLSVYIIYIEYHEINLLSWLHGNWKKKHRLSMVLLVKFFIFKTWMFSCTPTL